MKYKDFYLLKEDAIDSNGDESNRYVGAPLSIGEHECGGPISLDVDDPLAVIPCEESQEFPASSLYPNTKDDSVIRANNLKLANELIPILNTFKDVRGAKKKLIQTSLDGTPITGTFIKAIYYGLNKFKDSEAMTAKKALLASLKQIYKRSIKDSISKDELLETLTLKRHEQELIVVSDLEGRKEQSNETFRHKNELKKAGFKWDGKINSWTISKDKLRDAQTILAKINKKPVEVIINVLEDLPEFIQNSDNLSRKQELSSQIDLFVTDLSNEVDETAASAKVQAFLEFGRRFRSYSITNMFLIYLQKRDASRVAGFHTWKTKFHRNVKKGAKAISIFAPATHREVDDKLDDKDLDNEVRQRRVTRFIAVSVFDVSDTEPIDERGNIPEEPKWWGSEQPNETSDKIFKYSTELATAMNIKVTADPARDGEKGLSYGGHINITSTVEGAYKSAVMIHEIAHELMHHGESSLFYVETAKTKEQKELQAESVSYVVLRHYNLPVQHQATYLALWKADKTAVQSNLELIKKVSNFIIDEIDKIGEKGVSPAAPEKKELNEGAKGLALAGLIGASSLISPQSSLGDFHQSSTQSAETLGIRNNNPGNIKRATQKWQGEVSNTDRGTFCKFDSAENGIRAIAKTLKTYQAKYNIHTISDIISKWSPPSENRTDKYANFVAYKLAIDKNSALDILRDKETLKKIVKAIIEFENGKNPYSDSVIASGINKS